MLLIFLCQAVKWNPVYKYYEIKYYIKNNNRESLEESMRYKVRCVAIWHDEIKQVVNKP